MKKENPCGKCMAECCSKYSVCLNGYDIVRLAKTTGNLGWVDSIYAQHTDPKIARSFSLYENGKIRRYLLCLKMTCRENCVFLRDDNRCGVYENRPMICRIYPFNQRICEKLEYKENIRCPVEWKLQGGETEQFLKDIEKNKKELKEYVEICEEWDSLLTHEKTLKEFLEFLLAKIE